MFSRTFIVKNISNSSTYTVASSCVCTSPLAVMTIVGLHDFVKVSISASLRSFLLIICIDAPESTTISRSSGLRFDAGRHLFSEGEKNVALSCSEDRSQEETEWQEQGAREAAWKLAKKCVEIEKFWSVGAALMKFTWANISERRILVSSFSVTRNSFREFYTLDWSLHV